MLGALIAYRNEFDKVLTDHPGLELRLVREHVNQTCGSRIVRALERLVYHRVVRYLVTKEAKQFRGVKCITYTQYLIDLAKFTFDSANPAAWLSERTLFELNQVVIEEHYRAAYRFDHPKPEPRPVAQRKKKGRKPKYPAKEWQTRYAEWEREHNRRGMTQRDWALANNLDPDDVTKAFSSMRAQKSVRNRRLCATNPSQ